MATVKIVLRSPSRPDMVLPRPSRYLVFPHLALAKCKRCCPFTSDAVLTAHQAFFRHFKDLKHNLICCSFWFISRSTGWNSEAVNCNRTGFPGMALDVACLHFFISQGRCDPAAAITDASCEVDTTLSQHHDRRLFKPCFPSRKPFEKAQAHF